MRFSTWAFLMASLSAFADVSLAPDRMAHFLVHTVAESGELRTGILAVDLSARHLAWSRETRDTFEVRIPRLGNLLFLPHSREGRLECLQTSSGRVVWEEAPGPFRLVLPLSPDCFAIAGRSTEVTCWRRSSQGSGLQKVWSANLEGEEARDLVAAPGGRILVPTYRALFCLLASDGAILWRHTPPGAACTYAITAGGNRIVSWDWWGARLEAISIETGGVVWQETTAAPWVFGIYGGRVLARSGPNGRVRGLDPATGAELWSVENLGPQVVLPGFSDDLAYMPFAGPASHADSSIWFLTSDRMAALRLDPSSGVVRARRAFEHPLVGSAPAGRYVCFAESTRLLFVAPNGSWELDVPYRIYHLRQLARP